MDTRWLLEASSLDAMSVTTAWVLEDYERPWTANAERRWHFHKRAGMVREARARWAWIALSERMPMLNRVRVTATPLQKTRRGQADVAACYPAVKAAIDGLVDVGVLPGDTPAQVTQITFKAPQIADTDGLRLTIETDDE